MIRRMKDYMLNRTEFLDKFRRELREYCLPQPENMHEANGAYLYYRLLAAKARGEKYWESLDGRPVVYSERRGRLNADGTITWEE